MVMVEKKESGMEVGEDVYVSCFLYLLAKNGSQKDEVTAGCFKNNENYLPRSPAYL